MAVYYSRMERYLFNLFLYSELFLNLLSVLYFKETTHKVTLHTTLIRDQIGQGLGFSIAGGKGHVAFRDDCEGIYISKLTENGLAHKDGKILVGDRVLAVSNWGIFNRIFRKYSIYIIVLPL